MRRALFGPARQFLLATATPHQAPAPRQVTLLLTAASLAQEASRHAPSRSLFSFSKKAIVGASLIGLYAAYEISQQGNTPSPDHMNPIVLPTSKLTRRDQHHTDENTHHWKLVSGSHQQIVNAFIIYTLSRELDPALPPCRIVVDQNDQIQLAISSTISTSTVDQILSNPTSEAALLSACSDATVDTDEALNYLKLACLPMTKFTRGIRELRNAKVISEDEATSLARKYNALHRKSQDRLDDYTHNTLTL